MKRTWAAAAFFLASACSQATTSTSTSPTAARSASDPVVAESEVRRVLSILSNDSMEGRAPGTRGGNRAAAFIAREMKELGLTPLGDTAYFQKVPFSTPDGNPEKAKLLGSVAALDSIPSGERRLGYNVIGSFTGSDATLREQVVVFAAHYDHLGIGKPVNGDSIYNGADDDASGVTAVLEIARTFAKGPAPKRTVVIMLTTGEEAGALGTKWYVNHPAVPLSRMVAEMEVEMIGRPDSMAGGAGKTWMTGYERSTMGDQIKAVGIPIVPDPYPKYRFFERSDNIVFARMGIPAHTLSTYNLHSDYHTPADDIDRVDFPHMTAAVNAAIKAARILADGPAPQWKEGGRPVARPMSR
jgi:hypothetical protein